MFNCFASAKNGKTRPAGERLVDSVLQAAGTDLYYHTQVSLQSHYGAWLVVSQNRKARLQQGDITRDCVFWLVKLDDIKYKGAVEYGDNVILKVWEAVSPGKHHVHGRADASSPTPVVWGSTWSQCTSKNAVSVRRSARHQRIARRSLDSFEQVSEPT